MSDVSVNSSASVKASETSSLRKCKMCKEERPETKFKTNGYDKNGNRTRMITCIDCMSSKSGSSSVASGSSISGSEMIKNVKVTEMTKVMLALSKNISEISSI